MDIDTSKNLPEKINGVNDLLDKNIKQADNIKNAIDFFATKTALEQETTINKVVTEKQEELENDARAKKIKAETDRINEEVKKVIAEKQKEIEEYDKQITAKKKEVEQLKADSDKAQAFFDANSEILKYIGIKNKKSIGVMKSLMPVACIVFIIVQVLLFPLTFSGITIECLVNIIGGICGAIKNNALKIVISVTVVLLIIAVVILIYFYGGKLITKL